MRNPWIQGLTVTALVLVLVLAATVLSEAQGPYSAQIQRALANISLTVSQLADGTDGELITWDASGVAATVRVGTATHVLTSNGAGAVPTFQADDGATSSDHLGFFAATTSAQLAGVLSNETGSGLAVFGTSPTLTTPVLGAATGTSVDLGGTSLFASRALTVDTGGVFNVVLAASAGDDFTVDTTKLVVEGDNGNVGIGTATPNTGLSVLRSWTDAYASVSLSDSDNSSGAGITFYKNTFGTRVGFVGYDSKFKVWNIQNTDLDFATNDAVRMTIASGGDVGIGIAAGDGTLHVQTATAGSVAATAGADDLVVENSTHAGMTFLSPSGDYQQTIAFGDVGDADSGRIMYNHNSNALQFWTEGTQRVTIDSAGAVGIGLGATLPTRPLSVYHATLPVVQLGNSTTGANTTDGFQAQLAGNNAYLWNYENGLIYFGTNATERMSISAAGAVAVVGALSKGSGSFKIDHPLPALNETHSLVHSFIEGPRADLIYRGIVTMVDGSATVDLDDAAGMTSGTWALLCRDPQVFTSNATGWSPVRGTVSGSTLTIESEEGTSTDTVSWMVVAERQDQHMIDTEWTDEDGRPIIEPLKSPVAAPAPDPV